MTNVSWFAAEAYCRARGARLPTTEQWEYALADDGRGQEAVRERSLEWFAEPNPPARRRSAAPPTASASRDLVGLVWEWTLDFDAYATTAELRDPNGKDSARSAAARRPASTDPTDYPGFMRFSMRASLKAELHRRQPRLPLRGRRVMTFRSMLAGRRAGARCGRSRRQPLKTTRARRCQGPRSTISTRNGRPRTAQASRSPRSRGKPVVAAMGYADCKDMCPAIVADMMWIDKHLPSGAASRVEFVFFTFDSVADTPERLRLYADGHGLDLGHWMLLGADDDAVRGARRGARRRLTARTAPAASTTRRSSRSSNEQGEIVFQQRGTQASSDEFLGKLKTLLAPRM